MCQASNMPTTVRNATFSWGTHQIELEFGEFYFEVQENRRTM